MRHLGIDEAGYGPTLGPLAVVAVVADITDLDQFRADAARCGVDDSKRVHAGGNLARLEGVAVSGLTWLTGQQPRSAAAIFSLFGETPAMRTGLPWMHGADALTLPLHGRMATWICPSARPIGIHGRLLHPRRLNDLRRTGTNRAAAELDAVRELITTAAADTTIATAITCDRLGGRLRYGDLLQRCWPGTPVTTVEETAPACRYRCAATTIEFLVGGESASPLVALASCIAKYVRELHLRLFNDYWCARRINLKATAGYPQDAIRWLRQIDPADLAAWRQDLVRDGHSAGTSS